MTKGIDSINVRSLLKTVGAGQKPALEQVVCSVLHSPTTSNVTLKSIRIGTKDLSYRERPLEDEV